MSSESSSKSPSSIRATSEEKCLDCGALLPVWASECDRCGALRPRRCPACGRSVAFYERHCIRCGRNLFFRNAPLLFGPRALPPEHMTSLLHPQDKVLSSLGREVLLLRYLNDLLYRTSLLKRMVAEVMPGGVTPLKGGTLPWLEELVSGLSGRLGITRPALYIGRTKAPVLHSFGSPASSVLLVGSALLDEPPSLGTEMKICRELAHIRLGHAMAHFFHRLLTMPLSALAAFGVKLPSVLGSFLLGGKWREAAAYSADRVVCIVYQRPLCYMRVLVEESLGRGAAAAMDLPAFLELVADGALDEVPSFIPAGFLERRLKELHSFLSSSSWFMAFYRGTHPLERSVECPSCGEGWITVVWRDEVRSCPFCGADVRLEVRDGRCAMCGDSGCLEFRSSAGGGSVVCTGCSRLVSGRRDVRLLEAMAGGGIDAGSPAFWPFLSSAALDEAFRIEAARLEEVLRAPEAKIEWLKRRNLLLDPVSRAKKEYDLNVLLWSGGRSGEEDAVAGGRSCPVCGVSSPPGAVFCGWCGERLGS